MAFPLGGRFRSRMPARRAVVVACMGVGVAASIGCAPDPIGHALELTTVAPRDLEAGDSLEISGHGFPMRRPAVLRFDGELRRPSLPPKPIDLAVDVEAHSGEALVVGLGDTLVESLCGSGRLATHATFHGAIRVTFAPAERGAAPLSGRLDDVELDVHPPRAQAADLAPAAARANAMLGFIGAAVASNGQGGDGLPVTRVDRGSRADAAGLRVGDRVESADGLRVTVAADLAPIDDQAIDLRVRRPSGEVLHVRPSLVGFERRGSRGLLAVLGMGALASVALFALMAAVPPPLAWLERRLAARARKRLSQLGRARDSRPAGNSALAVLASLVDGGPTHAGHRDGTTAATLAAGVGIAALPWIDRMLPGGVDAGMLALGGLGVLGTIAALEPQRGRVTLTRLGRGVLWEIPALLVLVATYLRVGSLRIADLVDVQSAMPLGLGLLRAPIGALVLLVCYGAAFSFARPEGAPSSEDIVDPSPVRSRVRGITAATLITLLFLGGHRLPGHTLAEQGSPSILAVASAWLLAKVALVGVVRGSLRSLAARPAADRRSQRTFALMLPLAAIELATGIVAVRVPGAERVVTACGLLLAGTLAIAAALFIGRAWASLRWVTFEPADPQL